MAIADRLKEAEPALPERLTDRQQDGLEPLLAIAGEAGGEWPEAVRDAALEIFRSQAADDQNIGVQLLADLQTIFQDQDKVFTADLLGKLKEIETSPWADWSKGKGLTACGLSKLLKPFGITPRSIWIENQTAKGYNLAWFEDAFSRYIPAAAARTDVVAVRPSGPASLLTEPDFSSRQVNPDLTFPKSASDPHKQDTLTGLTFQKPLRAAGDTKQGVEKTLPQCAACGSFYLYREKDDSLTCMTCQPRVVN